MHEPELNKAVISDQRDEMCKLSDQVRLSLYNKPRTDHNANELRNAGVTREKSKNQPLNQPNNGVTEP